MAGGRRVGDFEDVVRVLPAAADEVGQRVAARDAGVVDVDEPPVVGVGVIDPAGGHGGAAVGHRARGGEVRFPLIAVGDEGEFNVTSGQKLIYMPDQLGSVRDVLDATTGTRVQSYDFNPYGSQNRANGSTPTDYRYAGLFLHTQSGLNLSATRPQDGVTGRFVNRDFLRELGGVNLYGYTGANPVNY